MKTCTKCKLEKEVSGFYKDRSKGDGLTNRCKACDSSNSAAYYQKNKQRVKERNRAYSKTPNGKKSRCRSNIKMREIHSEKWDARRSVRNAKKRGELVLEPCEACGTEKDIQAHHHKGYAKEHWLDVQWLCRPCHIKADKLLKEPNYGAVRRS